MAIGEYNRTRAIAVALLLLLSALSIAFLATPASAGQPDGVPPQVTGIERALSVADRHAEEILKRVNVTGLGVGANSDNEAVIRLLLLEPGDTGLPTEIDGVAVETQVTGMIVARGCDTSGQTQERCRPAPNGVSVGHADITAGTIGAIVTTDGTDQFILSNNHVLADGNSANAGDPILQPGAFDGGSYPADEIATLTEFSAIDFSGAPNLVDAAIAAVDRTKVTNKTLVGGYGAPSTTTAAAVLNTNVRKCGRTTGCTEGEVALIDVDVNVCYEVRSRGPFGTRCVKQALFENQIQVDDIGGTVFSAGGDSGSVVVNGSAQPVGLLFAGGGTATFVNPISAVLSAFPATGGLQIHDGNGLGGPQLDELPTVEIVSPADGATVAGNVTIQISATDDSAITSVRATIDGVDQAVSQNQTSGLYEVVWDTTAQDDDTSAIISATATDSAGQSSGVTSVTVTVNNSAVVLTLTDLGSQSLGRHWQGFVEVSTSVVGVTVEGNWSRSGNGSESSCTTAATASGFTCTLTTGELRKNIGSSNFDVNPVSPSWVGDFQITVSKP